MDENKIEDHERRLEQLEAAVAKLKPIVKGNASNHRSIAIGLVFVATILVVTISPKYSSEGTFTLEFRGLTIEGIGAGAFCVALVFNKNPDVLVGKLIDRVLRK